MPEITKPAHVDVLIVGAGLSGIGSAYHLRQKCPEKSFVIFEGRSAMGGTWDLFRYPGIRSDSDMYTLGYSFKPWMAPKAIADGLTIREYIVETARENRIDSSIRFDHKVVSAEWDSEKAQWLVSAERTDNGGIVQQTCNFLMMCSGYYNYDHGYKPEFEGENTFTGAIIHPQKWSEDIDYAGKKVVVIGSGATAVTLVPEMAKQAEHVTMLQRSPSYVVSRPSEDRLGQAFLKLFPKKMAYAMTRWKNVILQRFFFKLARSRPEKVKERLISMVREELGPDFDVEKHFTPKYNPWDQRLCLVPDSDLFQALKSGKADVVTDHIERFDETGIQLRSGEHLDADIVVTATGLDLAFLGKVDLRVDGKPVRAKDLLSYKGIMYSDVPNLTAVFGYTNASWTLKADLSAEFMCRVLNHMDKTGTKKVVPVRENRNIELAPWLDFSSGYVQRSLNKFPKQATSKPWRLNQDYAKDLFALRFGKLDDGVLTFSRSGEKRPHDKSHDISRSTNTVPAE
jgi:monooxygenase